jgi:hypothetical protein
MLEALLVHLKYLEGEARQQRDATASTSTSAEEAEANRQSMDSSASS